MLFVGGIIIVFLVNGLDWVFIYFKENFFLVKEIVLNGGLLLSEYLVG